jgi:hypothetical protein
LDYWRLRYRIQEREFQDDILGAQDAGIMDSPYFQTAGRVITCQIQDKLPLIPKYLQYTCKFVKSPQSNPLKFQLSGRSFQISRKLGACNRTSNHGRRSANIPARQTSTKLPSGSGMPAAPIAYCIISLSSRNPAIRGSS